MVPARPARLARPTAALEWCRPAALGRRPTRLDSTRLESGARLGGHWAVARSPVVAVRGRTIRDDPLSPSPAGLSVSPSTPVHSKGLSTDRPARMAHPARTAAAAAVARRGPTVPVPVTSTPTARHTANGPTLLANSARPGPQTDGHFSTRLPPRARQMSELPARRNSQIIPHLMTETRDGRRVSSDATPPAGRENTPINALYRSDRGGTARIMALSLSVSGLCRSAGGPARNTVTAAAGLAEFLSVLDGSLCPHGPLKSFRDKRRTEDKCQRQASSTPTYLSR